MAKLIIILLIGLAFESAGVVLLKKGMNSLGEINKITPGEIARIVKTGATNPQFLLGIFFETIFFGSLLILMKESDISFLWPMTALSFVFATVAASVFLHERPSSVRWIGVFLIMAGAALISYSEHARPKASTPAIQETKANETRL